GIGSLRTATGEDFFFGNSLGSSYLERMRITSAGRIAINTSTPQETLHVNGTMQLASELNVGGNATTGGNPGTAGQILTSNGAGGAPKWADSPIDADGTVNIANVAHPVINVNSRDNGTYVLDQTNA
ncbi:hypothetical protein, partial [Burkholderia sp. SIMBA_062]|uniref:hypothetical protein n=1 Tax=Burkholderia sp. SIMBA_062 TaxID=3085803 RepID=UPI0039790C76